MYGWRDAKRRDVNKANVTKSYNPYYSPSYGLNNRTCISKIDFYSQKCGNVIFTLQKREIFILTIQNIFRH